MRCSNQNRNTGSQNQVHMLTLRFAAKVISITVIGMLFFGASAFAHSGGTNKYGCHNDNERGGYHCHRSGC
jgi:hypothetical protein